MSAVIELEDVSFSFGDFPVVDGVSLSVEEGEFLGLVGPNGGGKTTLLKLMLGLLEPDRGQVRVLGGGPGEQRRHLGYVPQFATFVRDFPITALETVLQGRLGRTRLFGGYTADDHRIARRAMTEAEIAGLEQRPINALSGGQLQRVLIARALASEPRVLLLDEPTSNIDLRAEADIFDLLKRLNARMTIIVVSHDIAFISSYVSRIACLNRTLVCHQPSALTPELIRQLYGEHVQAIEHRHHHG